MDNPFFNQTIRLFQQFPEVDAITLGGSRASGTHDADSDCDVYVYLNCDLDSEKRKNALSQTCDALEINNRYWDLEDDCILKDGTPIEICYRSLAQTGEALKDPLEKHAAQCGYTTVVCDSVLGAKILYDPHGLYAQLVQRFTVPYPEPLRQNIIAKNRAVLSGIMQSYLGQIEKAIKRGDVVSVNHRVAEFLASYFDVLFAINRRFHPGQKRLIERAVSMCQWLPEDFETDLHRLFAAEKQENILSTLRAMIAKLDQLLAVQA